LECKIAVGAESQTANTAKALPPREGGAGDSHKTRDFLGAGIEIHPDCLFLQNFSGPANHYVFFYPDCQKSAHHQCDHVCDSAGFSIGSQSVH
jgi:hypothetical protein